MCLVSKIELATYFLTKVYLLLRSMFEKGLYSRSMKVASTGIQIATSSLEETRLLLADLWTVVGGSELETGNKSSYESLDRALKLRLQAKDCGLMDIDHPQIANSYMSLGTAAVGVGKTKEAIELGEKSILCRDKRKEDQIQMLAMSHHNVALASLADGQLEKAENSISKSWDLTQTICKSMTPEHRLYVDWPPILNQDRILTTVGRWMLVIFILWEIFI